ncbi:hypothetical protein ACFSYD_19005 [Paracoccus aerius]
MNEFERGLSRRQALMLTGGAIAAASVLSTKPLMANTGTMKNTAKITQVRNATILVEYAGSTFLIDPLLPIKAACRAFRHPPAAN